MIEVSDLNGQFIWIEDLIWCPSQCYYYFQDSDGSRYCIYLRWRYSDPWTAELVGCTGDWDFSDFDWTTLDIPFYSQYDYRKLEKEVLRVVSLKFPNLAFPNNIF